MKKLLTNLLLAGLLIGFISASPCNSKGLLKAGSITMNTNNYNGPEKETAFEIHPLDILSFKFQ